MLHYCEINVRCNINSHRFTIKKSWDLPHLTLIYKKFSNLINSSWNFYHFILLKKLKSSINCTDWNVCFSSYLNCSFSLWDDRWYNFHRKLIWYDLKKCLLSFRIIYQCSGCRDLQYKRKNKTTINEILFFICKNYFQLRYIISYF